ncbi:hypothetical protein GCM10023339_46510 [Alloalcanivorax gelatiniphagus]
MTHDALTARKGESVLTFDGTVLEIFGFPGTINARFHVVNLDLSVGEPDRKGARAVRVATRVRGAGTLRLEVPAEEWSGVQAIVDAVHAAQTVRSVAPGVTS